MSIQSAIAAAALAAPPFKGLGKPTVLDLDKILLIDGDILAYSAAGSDDTPTGIARRSLFNKVKTLQEITKAAIVVVHLTSSASHKGYRYLAAYTQAYQGNRNTSKRPKNWKPLRDLMESYNGDNFKVKLWHDREADDGLAYHVAKLQATRRQENIYLCTRDKDLRMVTGCTHINWDDYTEVFVPRDSWWVDNPYDEEKPFGHKWFWLQMLTGDPVDNIKGVHGIGLKGALKRLASTNNAEDAAQVVYKEYCKAYGTPDAYGAMYEHSLLLWLRDSVWATIYDVPVQCCHVRTPYGELLKERIDEYHKINSQ